jgi:glutamyl-tRNA reductase
VPLAVVGVSFHNTTLETRERVAFAPREVGAALDVVRGRGAREAVLLSTCNRTEFYVAGTAEEVVEDITAFFSDRLGEDASAFVFVKREKEAVAHLFRVACGLESMIIGEAQIAGQVREAWELGRSHSSTVLNRLFQSAALVSGRVRAETGISRGAASVSTAAVQLGKQIFGSLAGLRAMVLGAGEMGELALKAIVGEGVSAAIVGSRTVESAEKLAARHDAEAVSIEQAWDAMATVDLLLTSTSSEVPIVTAARLRQTLRARGDRPLCILDIAVPRDVEPDVRRLDNVFLYDIDDLKSVVAANLERRRAELPAAERIVAEEADRYWSWLSGLAAVPTLTEFRGQMERMRERELAAAMKKLSHLTPEQRSAFDQFSKVLMNKFLHHPSVKLREAAASDSGLETVDAVRYLFGLTGTGSNLPTEDRPTQDDTLDPRGK